MTPRLPFVSLAVALVAAALSLSSDAASWLELDRQAFASGQFWRLWTGHLVHYGPGHLLWDAVTVLVFGAMLEADGRRGLRRRTIAWIAVGAAGAIGAGFLLFVEPLTAYRGLSGLASLFFVWWAAESCQDARRAGDRFRAVASGLALLAFVAKSLFEVACGDALFAPASAEGFVPVPLAHVIGAIIGLLATFVRDESGACEAIPARSTAAPTGGAGLSPLLRSQPSAGVRPPCSRPR
jgi:rhomboid family GlyGly-CTERM serine protease